MNGTQPGKTLEKLLERVPPLDQLLFLDHLEVLSRQRDDLEMLHEAQAYRRLRFSLDISASTQRINSPVIPLPPPVGVSKAGSPKIQKKLPNTEMSNILIFPTRTKDG